MIDKKKISIEIRSYRRNISLLPNYISRMLFEVFRLWPYFAEFCFVGVDMVNI